MIKAVIFDIGGVVVKDPMDNIYKSVGSEFNIGENKVRNKYHTLNLLSETNRISTEEFWSRFASKLDIKDVRALESVWLEALKKSAILNKGVVKIIYRVKKRGYKIVALSNTMYSHERIHRQLGHYKFFSRVFLSNRMKMKKPDVRIYRLVADRLGVKPEECVFIDDKVRNAIGARKAGMKAVLFKNVTKLEKKLKKYL